VTNQFERRLRKLEKAVNPPSIFYVWQHGAEDMKAAIARVRAERNLPPNAEPVVVSWQQSDATHSEGVQ
jgi:hypothetical protein